jgi:branched-chain amino acid transport system permease protein
MRLLQNLIDGLGTGSQYALLAVGVSMLFGVMHLVNFAHGELLTMSAYVTYALRTNHVAWLITIPVAIVAAILLSMAIELVAFRRLRNASPFTLLLTSFAIEIFSHSLWRIFLSQKPRPWPTSPLAFKVFNVGSLRFQWYTITSVVVAVICFSLTALMLKKTQFGLAIRAASEDFDAARLMGVRSNRVISGAFAFAGLLAGIAAALFLAHSGQAKPNMGAAPLLKAVIAAIVGGLGSLKGAVVGGLALGLSEVLFRSYLPRGLQGLNDGFVFVLIALLFIVRPQGLFNVQNAERV